MAFYDRVSLTAHVYQIKILYIRRKNNKAFWKHTIGEGGSSELDGVSDITHIVAQLSELSLLELGRINFRDS